MNERSIVNRDPDAAALHFNEICFHAARANQRSDQGRGPESAATLFALPAKPNQAVSGTLVEPAEALGWEWT